jgi:hypothetical protein
MASAGEVTLWRAPSPKCRDPQREIRDGFDPADYPGEGLFFASHRLVADAFLGYYLNGLQELHVDETLFAELVAQGVILPDGFYPAGQSWHVLPADIDAFNKAWQQASPAQYYAQGS